MEFYKCTKYVSPLLIKTGLLAYFAFLVGEVTARGCASREKLYYVHCENHEMDGIVEKVCYCSFNLCNSDNQVKILDDVYNVSQLIR